MRKHGSIPFPLAAADPCFSRIFVLESGFALAFLFRGGQSVKATRLKINARNSLCSGLSWHSYCCWACNVHGHLCRWDGQRGRFGCCLQRHLVGVCLGPVLFLPLVLNKAWLALLLHHKLLQQHRPPTFQVGAWRHSGCKGFQFNTRRRLGA